MAWFSRRRLVKLAVVGVAVATVSALAIPSASANSRYDGWSPSSVSGCSSNYHIGDFKNNRLTAYNPYAFGGGRWEDYGWIEWRQSWTGNCKGYQWARLHIENQIIIWGGGWLVVNEHQTASPYVTIYPQIKPQEVNVHLALFQAVTVSKLYPGTYDAGLLYSMNNIACTSIASYAFVNNWDNYTYARIYGQVCR
jgi:hypothetical protein